MTKKINKDAFALIMAIILAALFTTAVTFCLSSCSESLADEYEVQPSDWSEGVKDTPVYLMSSIGANQYVESDNLHLAYSTDGLNWTTLNSNQPVFKCGIGSQHIRDPYIFRLNDGSFVLLASDFTYSGKYWDLGSRSDLNYWSHPSNRIYVAFSSDLITWTKGHMLTLTKGKGTNGATRHCWSPKAVYNKEDKCYDIYWTGDNEIGINNVYVSKTNDFQFVKSYEDNIIYNPGYSVTWADVVKTENNFYLFARDENVNFGTNDGGDIQCASVSKWGTAFKRISKHYINRLTEQDKPELVQHPCVYQLNDVKGTWAMLVNKTNDLTAFETFVTEDISNPESWKSSADASLTFNLPDANCDVSVTKITADELDALLAAF